MANRRPNPRQAKSLLCYSIAATADLYGVHRNTVRNWLANGLRPIDDARPTLFRGAELNRFHKARRGAGKQVCGPGEMFCFGCRVPRRPAYDMADYVPMTDKVGTLSGICPTCERMMAQRVNAARLASASTELDVSVRPAHRPLEEGR